MGRPRLLVVSLVLPEPGSAGQQIRVRNTLSALRSSFEILFLTAAAPEDVQRVADELQPWCDEPIVLASRRHSAGLAASGHRARALLFQAQTGLKTSNYYVDRVDFPPDRIAEVAARVRPSWALFGYWHASRAARALRALSVRTALDMHDVLWQSHQQRLRAQGPFGRFWAACSVPRYRRREEQAWSGYDLVIAINRAEADYVRTIHPSADVIYVPMGIDMPSWPYLWTADQPVRIAFYGGLSSRHNQRDAEFCYQQVMPRIWARVPSAEFWLIGGGPPQGLSRLEEQDRRVRVTGFVPDPAQVLSTMSVVLCPWSGTFGFRSRLVEMMAAGVPVVASSEAVFGMDFENGRHIRLADSATAMAEAALTLIGNRELAEAQSRAAREDVETRFGFAATYGVLAAEMARRTSINEKSG